MTTTTDTGPGTLSRFLPILRWLPAYEAGNLRLDLVAGLTVWALLVPEAMAYADMAGVPPEVGLYAAPGALLGYAIFGTSRQLNVGPSSTVAILSAATVGAVVTQGTEEFVALTAGLALMVAVLFVAFGLARLGFVSQFLSRPVLTGFTFGLALVIAIGQANKIFGVEGGSGNFFEQAWALVQDLPDADLRTTLIGLGALALLFGMGKLWGHKVPGALIVLFLSIALSAALNWEENGVHVVGEIPAGLPDLGLPDVSWSEMSQMIGGALGIVIVGFAESLAAAKTFARKHGYTVDPNQELIALGAANAGSGIAGGFVVDGSLSKSAAADEAGATSQMAMLICAAVTLVTIVALTPLFHDLPEAVLAAIVIHAVWGLFKVAELKRLWRANRGDFVAAAGALVGVCLLDLLPGLLLAVAISFITLVYRASKPGTPKLGRPGGLPVYASLDRFPEAETTPGVPVLRFDAPLFFANVAALGDRIDELTIDVDPPTRALVLDLETVSYIDSQGADALGIAAETLRERGVELYVSRLNAQGQDALRRAEVFDVIGVDAFFPSVRLAVAAALGEPPPDEWIENR